MAHYVFQGDGGIGRNGEQTFSIPAAGDDIVIFNESGSTIEIDFQFPATLSGTVYRANDSVSSLKETVSGNFTFKLGAEAGARIHVDNSSTTTAADVTVPESTLTPPYSAVRTTHRTAGSDGASVWVALG